MTPEQKALGRVIDHLLVWQKAHKGKTAKRCLEGIRWALGQESMHLPYGNGIDYEGNTAIENFRALIKNPGHWKWKQAHKPLPRYVLVYFVDCGKLKDGRIAGHIAIWDTVAGKHYANRNWRMTPAWSKKVRAAFILA